MTRILPVIADVVLVIVFAALGRRSHAEGLDLGGILRTAGPFLCGTAGGWILATALLDQGPRTLAFGAVVAASTIVIGLALRRVIGLGTAPSFMVVATLVLTLSLLGWRLATRAL